DWDLVTIHSAQRNVWLSALLGSVADAWVGASDMQTEGAWRWVGDGAPFWNGSGGMGSPVGSAYVNWSLGSNPEPNGGDASDCLRLRSGGGWADYQCNSPFASICEGPSL
ncbi:MAG TPA: C-type lectin domain-containing protein, partial [Polyangiaceae bacterium]|nr:C-type lectin domain-containing protein [Polyangiaceae bacterium]